MTRCRHHRSGAAAVEAVLVLAVLMIVMLGSMVCGIGVFRHQQVACMATEAARYASVRGGDFFKDTNKPPPTVQQIVDAAVTPKATGLAASAVTVNIDWLDKGAGGGTTGWDAAPKDVRSVTASGEYITNTVRVTVTYLWTPGVFFGPTTLTAVCEVPMAY